MTHERTTLSTRDVAEAAVRRGDEQRDATPVAAPPSDVAMASHDSDDIALFPREEVEGFRSRWEAIQTGFVDEPKAAVGEADGLVAQVVTRLAQVFSDEKNTLEQQWDRGDAVSTEDLRLALKRYRAFFHRLLSV
jgi:hypothetical protein